MLLPLHDPESGIMRVAGLMSGSGTNLRRIIENEERLARECGESPYRVVVIFSDCFDSKAVEIGKDYDIPVVTRDINAFYKRRGRPKKDLSIRREFDNETVRALSSFNIKVAAYAGYMSIATPPLIKAFLGINVHPADLSVKIDGRRKYTGDHAVLDAIREGERDISSSTHIIEEEVDQGRILMISRPMKVIISDGTDVEDSNAMIKVVDENQERLKEFGDWIIFPKTIEFIAAGRYSVDESGNLYFDNKPIPEGVRL